MTQAEKIAAAPPFWLRNDANRYAKKHRIRDYGLREQVYRDGSVGYRLTKAS